MLAKLSVAPNTNIAASGTPSLIALTRGIAPPVAISTVSAPQAALIAAIIASHAGPLERRPEAVADRAGRHLERHAERALRLEVPHHDRLRLGGRLLRMDPDVQDGSRVRLRPRPARRPRQGSRSPAP